MFNRFFSSSVNAGAEIDIKTHKDWQALDHFLKGFSIEVMPRTAAKISDFRAILPAGTRVYIAHIEGSPIDDMLATASRLKREGFVPMPHIPARHLASRVEFENWVRMYADVGVEEALVLAGGMAKPYGEFDNSMQLLETGVFDAFGFKRLHVAGHPEGNKDIDKKGSDENLMAALRFKQQFAERTDAKIALVTQFCFESKTVIKWGRHLRAAGITLPIHIGVAGPAKLTTLLNYALVCGVGPSLKVVQKKASDATKLLTVSTPEIFLSKLALEKQKNPEFPIENVHFFPLGGITRSAEWVQEMHKRLL